MVEYIKFTPDVAKDWKSAQSLVLKDDDFKQYQARIRDACTASQLESKLWLVTELVYLNINFTNALLLGGWYANFIVPLLVDNLSVKYILNLELDPDVKKLSYKFNKRYMPDTKVGDKFTENFYPSDNKNETPVYKCDIRDVMFKPIKPDVWGDWNPQVTRGYLRGIVEKGYNAPGCKNVLIPQGYCIGRCWRYAE